MEEREEYEVGQPTRDERCPDCGWILGQAAYGSKIDCPSCGLSLVYRMDGPTPRWLRVDDKNSPEWDEQEEPHPQPPASILQVHFEGPGIANITNVQTLGEVTLGQLTYLAVFLFSQTFINFLMPAMGEASRVAMLETLKEAFSPKIEAARSNFRIPDELLRGVN